MAQAQVNYKTGNVKCDDIVVKENLIIGKDIVARDPNRGIVMRGNVFIDGKIVVEGGVSDDPAKYDCTPINYQIQDSPSTKVSDTTLIFAGIAQCNLKSQIRIQKGLFNPPAQFQFDKAIYPPFLEFQPPPPDLTSFEGGPQGYLTPLANFLQDKLVEYYTAKGTLEIYKDPVGASKFTFHSGGATLAEAAIHNAFAFEGTALGGTKNYIILQALPNYNGPASFGASLDTPNVWNLMYQRGNAASTVAQINDAVARLKSGLAPQMTTDPSQTIWVNPNTLNPPRSTPPALGNWEIIEWIITPGNPRGDLPTIDHDLDAPVGAVDWLPRTTFVVDAAFSTPAYQPIGQPNCVQHAINLVQSIRANPAYELITFGSISKQFGLVSVRVHYCWFPYKLWFNRPNWVQWYDRSIVASPLIGYHSIEHVLNHMQEELDGDLGAQDDAQFNSVNVQIQQALLNEFQTLHPGNVTLLSTLGGPVLYLQFAPAVYAGFPTMVDYLGATYGIALNNSIQYNTPNVLVGGQTIGAGQTRFATCNGTDDYVAVLNRVAGYDKYKPSDFLPTNGVSCKVVKAVPHEDLTYYVSIDDQIIFADATHANVNIVLPSLQSFASIPRHIQIKNIGSTDGHIVNVSTSSVVPASPLNFNIAQGVTKLLQWQSKADLSDGKWVNLLY